MNTHNTPRAKSLLVLLVGLALVATACGSDDGSAADDVATTTTTTTESSDDSTDTSTETTVAESDDTGETETVTFVAEVWADNWFALHVNGELVGEDSVSITTERSFNAETITFDATYPLTVAIEARDFKETDSGLEYIGESNQQMGDGGLIAQITDTTTGEVVAVTGSAWASLVTHQAPLNTECEDDPDPDATCEFAIIDTPADWTSVDFDDSRWEAATEWTEAAVAPKDGYNEINWDASAQLIWGADLEVDNTVLLRLTVPA